MKVSWVSDSQYLWKTKHMFANHQPGLMHHSPIYHAPVIQLFVCSSKPEHKQTPPKLNKFWGKFSPQLQWFKSIQRCSTWWHHLPTSPVSRSWVGFGVPNLVMTNISKTTMFQGKIHDFDWVIFQFTNCKRHCQMVNPHQIPWNHHFPMVFLWFF